MSSLNNTTATWARGSLGLAFLVTLVTCGEPGAPTITRVAAPAASALLTGTITQTLMTSSHDVVNQKVYTTVSIAPTPNTLITVAVLGHNSTSAPASPMLSGGGMTTWTEVASVTFDNAGSPHKRLTVFRAMSATPGGGPLTITFSKTMSDCQWIVSQWSGVDQNGTNGSGAIGQTGSNVGDGVTGLTVGLGAFSNSGNVAYGVFGVASKTASVTPGNGFTEISEEPSGESTPADLEAELGTSTPSIVATWGSANGGGVGIEIRAGGGSGGGGTGTVSGTVTSQGLGVGGVIVRVDPGGQTATTAGDGGYKINGVPVGPSSAAITGFPAQCSQPQPSSISVDVTDGGTVTADFTITCPSSQSGSITEALLTSGHDAANQKVYTTTSIAPTPNTLITVAVLGHNSTSAPASPTLSGGGMTTWTEVASVAFDNAGSPHKRLTVFRAMSATPGAGPLTITFSKTMSDCQWIVSQWSGVDQNGTNGSGAIGQTGSNVGDGVTGLTVGLGAFSNSGNVAYGVFGVASKTASVSPGSGFAEISEEPSGESTPADLEAEWATDMSAINSSWNGANGAGLGIELRVGGPGYSHFIDFETLPDGSLPEGGPLTDQYASQGITFGADYQTVEIADFYYYREAGATGTWGAWYGFNNTLWWFTFSSPPADVMFDGYGWPSVTIRAYDSQGSQIPSSAISEVIVPLTTVYGVNYYKVTTRVLWGPGISKIEFDQSAGTSQMIDNIRF